MSAAARRLSPLLLLTGFILPVRADLVTDANFTLRQAIRDASTGATAASREFALLQTAIFDAVNGINTQYQFYRVAPAAAPGSSPEAAAATAAHAVLTSLYPTQAPAFDATLSAQLGALPAGPSRDNGAFWGSLVATNILNWRANDHSTSDISYVAGSLAGDWRPTAPTFGTPDSPQWPGVTPWIMSRGDQFRPGSGPPLLNSQTYTADYTEVFELGESTGLHRTTDQTTSALFWSYAPGSQTAVGHWNSIAQAAVAGKGNTLVENARLFAALNTALADAAIVSSDAAYTYEFWRPIAAIREAAIDDNVNTAPFLNWDSLVPTPLSPEYLSANAANAGAAAGVLNHLLGTETAFTIGSDSIPTASLFFADFDAAAADAGLAGIYGGIQFRTSVEDGLAAGQSLGSHVVTNFFQPVTSIPEPSAAALALLAAASTGRRRRA